MHVNEAAALISKDASLGGLHCQLMIFVVRLDWAFIWSEDFVWFKKHQSFCGVSGNLRFDLISSSICLALQGTEKSLEMGLKWSPEPN